MTYWPPPPAAPSASGWAVETSASVQPDPTSDHGMVARPAVRPAGSICTVGLATALADTPGVAPWRVLWPPVAYTITPASRMAAAAAAAMMFRREASADGRTEGSTRPVCLARNRLVAGGVPDVGGVLA